MEKETMKSNKFIPKVFQNMFKITFIQNINYIGKQCCLPTLIKHCNCNCNFMIT